MKKIRWGILATGNIARKFTMGLQQLPGAIIQAVGSRTLASAVAFAHEFDIADFHGSYEELVANPEIDVIYVATPHTYHKACVSLCLEAGKHVLCEKPIATNSEESIAMIQLAREKNLFLMEAMWTRFLPSIVQLRNWLNEGLIGDVRFLQADFGFYADFEPKNRKFNPQLAGGALLDLGIYPISLAYMVFGKSPVQTSSFAHLGRTNVDELSAYMFGYENGAVAQLSSTFSTNTPRIAHIMGTKGSIRLPLFWKAQEIIVQMNDEAEKSYKFPFASTGLQFQAKEVMDCIRTGKTESQIMSLDESQAIMKMMDSFRSEWGMKYPWE